MLITNQGILLNLNLATLETGQILASDPTGRWVINVWPGDLGIAAQEDLDTAQATADAAGLLATAAKSTADTASSAIATHAGRTDNPHNVTRAQLGAGTVTSIGIEAPADVFSIEAAPITTAGTFHLTLASQLQGTVLAAPSDGNGTPLFRQLAAADVSGLGTAATLDTGTDAGDVAIIEGSNTDDLVAWGGTGLVSANVQPWQLAKWSNDTDRAMVCDGLNPCLTFQPIADQVASVYVLRGLDAAGAQLTWWIDLDGTLGTYGEVSVQIPSGGLATDPAFVCGTTTVVTKDGSVCAPNHVEVMGFEDYPTSGNVTAGVKFYARPVPVAGSLVSWYMRAAASGNCSVKVSKIATDGSTLTELFTAALSAAQAASDTVDYDLSAGEFVQFEVTGTPTVTGVSFGVVMRRGV